MYTENTENELPTTTPKKTEKTLSPRLQTLMTEIAAVQDPEKKIQSVLEFMRTSINHHPPHFKDFWEARRQCLIFFKEHVSAKVRQELWTTYIELSLEGRRLRDILEEQSSFAVEQIELAIKALEDDLTQYDALHLQMPLIDFPGATQMIREKKEVYNTLQRELHLLNTFASRVNSLRKEVVKTEMRVKHKTKFFEQLSKSGDWVFPRRKELIQNVSAEFLADVQQFIQSCDQEDARKLPPFYLLKEEIKALQTIAKMLTLNTHAFTETRLLLSACWDKVRQLEKDRKKEIAEKRQVFRKNYDAVIEKLDQFKAAAEGPQISKEELLAQFEEIREFMRSLSLGREEIVTLRDEFKHLYRECFEVKEETVAEETEADLSLPTDNFEEALENRKRERQEVKEALEALRKELSESGFDFEQAMKIREKVEKKKNRLMQINELIDSIIEINS